MKRNIRSLISLSVALSLGFSTLSFAASSQHNKSNVEVMNALKKMQQGIELSVGEHSGNPQKTTPPALKQKDNSTQTKKNPTSKKGISKNENANTLSVLHPKVCREVHVVPNCPAPISPAHYNTPTISKPAHLIPKTNENNSKKLHSVQKKIGIPSVSSINDKKFSKTSNLKTSSKLKEKKFDTDAVNSIFVKPNQLDISFKGAIEYKVVERRNRKVVYIDIINPHFLPTEFAKAKLVKLKPNKKGLIKSAIAYFHSDNNDKLIRLYNKPFLRIGVHLSKSAYYKIMSSNGKLSIIITTQKPTLFAFKKKEKTKYSPVEKKKDWHRTLLGKGNQKISLSTSSNEKPFISESKAQSLYVSLKSISRIVSPYPIKQVIYSKEQRIQIQIMGDSIYIKPLPTKILMPDGSFVYQYSDNPKDIYIITERKVYSLHLVPKDIPSVTYKLKPVEEMGNEDIKNANKLFLLASHGGNTTPPKESDYISNIVYLLKLAYSGNLSGDYTILPLKREFTIPNKYTAKGQFKFTTSLGSVAVYKLTALKSTDVDYTDFGVLLNNPSAVMALENHLNKGESTYLYVAYVGGDQDAY